ncbi:MAG: response regulator [Hyphomicrobiales bacterium]|nr:response regulator [Hyphomicrobiales bacterium]
MHTSPHQAEILLVEDNPGDVLLTKEMFARAHISNMLHVARDGEMALAMLKQEGQYMQQPRPDLVLLDLNLPRLDGREVLAEMKRQEHLRHIPVVILTGSRMERDITKVFGIPEQCYMTKPITIDKLAKVLNVLGENFCFSLMVPAISRTTQVPA